MHVSEQNRILPQSDYGIYPIETGPTLWGGSLIFVGGLAPKLRRPRSTPHLTENSFFLNNFFNFDYTWRRRRTTVLIFARMLHTELTRLDKSYLRFRQNRAILEWLQPRKAQMLFPLKRSFKCIIKSKLEKGIPLTLFNNNFLCRNFL